ncbi:hypothetical protein FRACYDRAFT_251179 [Fragilariopsis cylindrus CCMP1102]|uniref:Uncharacterized protein n=1 Tax=Fragilariopsis cylindrus CCMP1102 TaxID=635003 RepID=A0A1E7EN50_9STRA|nr:hypothetical protein FRACYDRAFT_251179 [Fragilariopsis cylindrus CCMP1102]|eukprot:OEU07372.1 hypothetical protein FRACYDRAFT_251179 [Fragilariopsis cylindrus CCMP1102]
MRFKGTNNDVVVAATSNRLMCCMEQQQQQQQQQRRGLHLSSHPLHPPTQHSSRRPLFPITSSVAISTTATNAGSINNVVNINNVVEGRRYLSFYSAGNDSGGMNSNANSNPNMGNPAYIVYGEEIAFSVKAIPPEFRTLPSGTVILDAGKRGRLMFEWTPLSSQPSFGDKKAYAWDKTTRFALTAEELGSLLARLDRGDTSVEYTRRLANDHHQNSTGLTLDKIFIATVNEIQEQEEQVPIKEEEQPVAEEGTETETEIGTETGTGTGTGTGTVSAVVKVKKNDGISLLIDYVDADTGHQFGNILHPPSAPHDGIRGPFEIRLMVGEYRVLRSIIEYSIPKLIGWSTMFDKNIEQSITKSVNAQQQGGGGGGNNNNNQGGGGYGGMVKANKKMR